MDGLERQVEFMDVLTPSQSRLFGYIYALVQNLDEAQDLYQQTVLVLWRKFDSYESGTNFIAWARRTAQLEFLRHQRTKRQSKVQFSESLVAQMSDAAFDLPKSNMMDSRFDALVQCMGKLPEPDLLLVDECYSRGTQIKQIAEKTGRSSQSICNSLRRVRAALLRCIDGVIAQGGNA